jgi:hypothetical protein
MSGPLTAVKSAAFMRFGRFDEQARRAAAMKMQNPVKVAVDRAPAGLGSMSTQRRANRTTPAIKNDRAGIRCRWFRGRGGRTGISIPETRTGCALASSVTAPLMSIFWLAWIWLHTSDVMSQEATTDRVATNSLYSDIRFATFTGLGCHSSSPPLDGAGERRLSVPRGTHRSSLPRIPSLPVRSHLRRPLPQAPAGEVRWAERHDGKRDLYFQHAA